MMFSRIQKHCLQHAVLVNNRASHVHGCAINIDGIFPCALKRLSVAL